MTLAEQTAAMKSTPPQNFTSSVPFMPSSLDDNPMTKFNLGLLSILQGNRVSGAAQSAALQTGALQQMASPLSPELQAAGLNPQQIASIQEGKGGGIGISSPESILDNAAQQFESTLQYVRDYNQEYVKALKPSDDAIMGYKRMMKNGVLPSADVMEKIGKYITQEDWDAYVLANKNEKESTGGGTSKYEVGGGSTYTKAFKDAVENGIANLQRGEPWGTVWNRIKAEFPNESAEKIDTALGGGITTNKPASGIGPETAPTPTGWAKPGAFEEYKQKQFKATTPTSTQINSQIWTAIAEAQADGSWDASSSAQKKQFVAQMGGDPEDFNIY